MGLISSKIYDSQHGQEVRSFDGHPAMSFRHASHIAPVPRSHLNETRLGYEFAEHGFLGDSITLQLANGASAVARNRPFELGNGLSVTYGQINGLAGDFYGAEDAISDGKSFEDQCHRFTNAWNTLADKSTRQPQEGQAILKILSTEVKKVNEALKKGVDPSTVYADLADQTLNFILITQSRPSGSPDYLGLARTNWDHFGDDARTAYNAGHYVALKEAASGKDEATLLRAYALNAFADHYLEDLFSAGHMRTPRRQLHNKGGALGDFCGWCMHDEDNAIGLAVTNEAKTANWTMYGDKRLFDKDNVQNRKHCVSAVQASADEIFTAWSTQKVPSTESFKAWKIAPTIASARANTQALAPLFTFEDHPQRRSNIYNRREWKFTKDWGYWSTQWILRNIKRKADPIKLD